MLNDLAIAIDKCIIKPEQLLQETLNRFSLGDFPLRFKWCVEYLDLDMYKTSISYSVIDSNQSGELIQVRTSVALPKQQIQAMLKDEGHLIRWFRAQIINAINHEIDEHLRLDGVRVREPHPENESRLSK